LKLLQQLPEAALRRLEYSLRRQARRGESLFARTGCCDLSRPAACQATLHTPWDEQQGAEKIDIQQGILYNMRRIE